MTKLLEHILSGGNMLVALNKVKANKGAVALRNAKSANESKSFLLKLSNRIRIHY